MLVSTYVSAGHRTCIHLKLAAVDVEAVLVLREDDDEVRGNLFQRLDLDRLIDRRASIAVMHLVRRRIRPGLHQICQDHPRVGIPGRTRIYTKGSQSAMCSTGWTRDDSFEPSRGRQQYMTGRAYRGSGVVVREGQSVKRHDLKCLSIQLQVQIAVRGRVYDTPELPLFRGDLDLGANRPVHGKDFLDCLGFSPASLGWNFNIVLELAGILVMLDGAAAHNEYTLTESPYLGSITFHSLDDDCS